MMRLDDCFYQYILYLLKRCPLNYNGFCGTRKNAPAKLPIFCEFSQLALHKQRGTTMFRSGIWTIGVILAVALACKYAGAVDIDLVTVGNPGNAGELSGAGAGGYGPDLICGAVSYRYRIGKYEVTAAQYTEFLNAVAKTDTHGLYDTKMSYMVTGCKIERSGTSGSYIYSVAPDQANRPVNYVSFWDACRFANWLHNDQPIGEQNASTTEDGAYYLNGVTNPTNTSISRKASWKWAIPSEDEWYKAAYHKNDGVTSNYFDYPTSSDSTPSNDLVDPDPGNNATFIISGYPTGDVTIGAPYYRTEAGAHENTKSPYGTFDQGGNVDEWTEGMPYNTSRVFRGGYYENLVQYMHAAYRNFYYPYTAQTFNGFRVVSVPEPDSDDDGVPDTGDNCPDTPPGEPVDINGCSCSQLDTDSDGVSNCNDNCADTAPGEPVDENGCSCSQKSCNDGNACTTDTCNPATAACVYTPITCNDNNACTTDTCDPATGCVYTPITCDDSDACTTDTCEPVTGCVFTPDLTDTDGDGVVDCNDQCPDSPTGSWINRFTGCPTSRADLDRDGDVDQDDFGIFQRCVSGSNIPADPDC